MKNKMCKISIVRFDRCNGLNPYALLHLSNLERKELTMLENNQEKELVLLEDLGLMYPRKTSRQKQRYGLYKCFCGKEFKTMTQSVKRGHTSSCGCYQKEKTKESKTTHGLRSHRLYSTWNNIISRCSDTKCNKDYANYSGRGITVCERWLNVENFISDMYPTFKEGLSIDRIDNDKGYSKDNCRWATKTEQSINQRIRSTNTSGYMNVYFDKNRNKFRTEMKINGKTKYLGIFNTAKEAAIFRNNYIIENNLINPLNEISE